MIENRDAWRLGVTVRKPSDLPRGQHWAIIEFTSIYIPGDERSRTNPGHGYPASNEEVSVYTAFTDEEAFKSVLLSKMQMNHPCVGIHVDARFEKQTTIGIVRA